MRLIAGLGNPGKEYQYTRHNLGFLAVQCLAQKLNLKLVLSSFTNGLTAQGIVEGHQVCLLMPLTYMNNSGAAVGQVVTELGLSYENILVICDDFNLDFQRIRLRASGGDGGHNGIKFDH